MILVVALLVLGPKRLPEMASGLGKAIRDFKRATSDIQNQLEVDEAVGKPLAELRSALTDMPPPPKVRPIPGPTQGTVVATSTLTAAATPPPPAVEGAAAPVATAVAAETAVEGAASSAATLVSPPPAKA